MINNIYTYIYISPPAQSHAFPTRAPRTTPGPTAAAVAHCGSGGTPSPQAPRTAPGPAGGRRCQMDCLCNASNIGLGHTRFTTIESRMLVNKSTVTHHDYT